MKGPEIRKGMVTVKFICKNLNCDVKDCIHHHETLKNYSVPHKIEHLEENPLYCKKENWNRYQTQTQSNKSTASR